MRRDIIVRRRALQDHVLGPRGIFKREELPFVDCDNVQACHRVYIGDGDSVHDAKTVRDLLHPKIDPHCARSEGE